VSAARAVAWQRRTATLPELVPLNSWFGRTTSCRCRQFLACDGGLAASPRCTTGADQTMKQSDGLCKQWLVRQDLAMKQP